MGTAALKRLINPLYRPNPTIPCVGAGLVLCLMAPKVQAAQPLVWTPCNQANLPKFECARFERPLNRNKPNGEKVSLAIARLRATGRPNQKIGSLFFNPGGPGAPGLQSAYQGTFLPDAIRQSFDFVTWDPRGLGASSPSLKECSIGMPERPTHGAVNWTSVLEQRIKQLSTINQTCAKRHKALIERMGTIEVVHDLDALRAAVGDQKLNFWGVSYGTVIGSTYASLFPEKVRTLILDGNVNPWINLTDLSSASLSADDGIRFFLQTNPDLKEPLDRVIRSLNASTLLLPDGSEYSRWDLLDSMLLYLPISMLSDSYVRTLIETTDQALFGQINEKIEARKRLQNDWMKSPKVDNNSAGGFAAIACQDFPQRPSEAELKSKLNQLKKQNINNISPLFGGSLATNYLALCSGYERIKSNPIPRARFKNNQAKGLITNASLDPITPYKWALAMARSFPNMRMLTYIGNQHGIVNNSQSKCVEQVVTKYLLSASLPKTDETCGYVAPKRIQQP